MATPNHLESALLKAGIINEVLGAFPGLLTNEEVNGADLVDWLSGQIQELAELGVPLPCGHCHQTHEDCLCCDCDTCVQGGSPCQSDCDASERCLGCLERYEAAQDARHDLDSAQGCI